MKTAALKGLTSRPATLHSKDGQLPCPGPQFVKLWQEWLDWAKRATTAEYSDSEPCSYRRNDRAVPMLYHCLKHQKKELDLSALGQKDFPAHFPSHITTLSLELNWLTDIKDIVDNLPPTLENLNIGSNPLETVLEYYPPNLVKLEIRNANIVCLPESFVRALSASLKVLDLSANRIASLPRNFSELAGLDQILLIKNKLTDVQEEIFRLRPECKIYLSGNPIPAERLQQIEARINAPDYQGPRIFLRGLPGVYRL